MEVLGYVSLSLMGMTLGLVGAGGSILTIPILVYLLNIPIVLATSYSLLIVGATAMIASIRYQRNILFLKAILFLIPSLVGVFIARQFIITKLPHTIGSFSIDTLLVILLLVFIAFAGYFMIKNITLHAEDQTKHNKSLKIILTSLCLGLIMGLLGAGGGFLIIPTLVLMMGFSMKEAVPTSLFIITINSFTGFIADKHVFELSDWTQLGKYLFCALIGMMIGLYTTKFIENKNLKKTFGYFIWTVGIAIFIKEFML